MADVDHLAKLKEGTAKWNEWRNQNPLFLPDLGFADLCEVSLREANLSSANLSMADLSGSDLRDADLGWANLSGANLSRAKLIFAGMREANLDMAILEDADLKGADLRKANLTEADLTAANINMANLKDADLTKANLQLAIITDTILDGANFDGTRICSTYFGNVNLSLVCEIENAVHIGPSTIGIDTFKLSKGRIPEAFLEGCSLSSWEIEISKLFDPELAPKDVAEILSTRLFHKRMPGPMLIGSVFISYSHEDGEFVGKLERRLKEEGISVWRDVDKLVAGNLQEQIFTAISQQDVVITVLSKNSVDSDWVEAELENARKKEKNENRAVLCPIAIDGSWKTKIDSVLRLQLGKKNILDFSEWQDEASFDTQFEKLIKGLKVYYGKAS